MDIISGTGGSTTSGTIAAEAGGAINITTGDGGNQDVSGNVGGDAGDLTITLGAGGTGSAQGAGGVLHIRTATGSADPAEMLLYESRNAGLNHRGIKVPASFASSIVYTLPGAPASNDYLLKCATDGTMAWVDPATVGGGAFTDSGASDYNLYAGLNSGGNLVASGGQYNFLAGYNAGPQITTGDRNVVIGYTNGHQSTASTGSNNVIIGSSSGGGITTGTQNFIIGAGVGVGNGSNNIAIGRHGSASDVDYTLYMGIDISSSTPPLIGGTFGRPEYQTTLTRYGEIHFNVNDFTIKAIEDTAVQETTYVLVRETTDATQTEMFVRTTATDRMVLTNDSTWRFEIDVVARRTDADGESASYKFVGCIDRNATAGSTALVGTVTKTVEQEDTAAWDVDVDADTTNGSLRIRVTGEASKTIKWAAFAKTIQIVG
jgi:hypothetical protein